MPLEVFVWVVCWFGGSFLNITLHKYFLAFHINRHFSSNNNALLLDTYCLLRRGEERDKAK